jgi:hypothetical protein
MNQHLINYIDAKLNSAANFVCKFMPVDITVDSAYEAMLGCSNINTEPMITAFREAVKYLDPQSNFKRFNFTMGDGRIASIQARFTPTEKWPAFLIPTGNLTINPEGKFAALLETPIRVATEWESLTWVWGELRSSRCDLDVATLAYLMPWIRECLADFDNTMVPIEVSRQERKIIDKELSTVMNDAPVLFFPRMGKALSETVRSGRVLLSQYRMIDAAYSGDTLTVSPITVDRTPSLLEPWLKEHMAEALDEWVRDKAQRMQRQLDEVARKAAKRYDQKVRRGTKID